MEVTIKAEPKEVASLVLELQGRPEKVISVSGPKGKTPEERERLVRTIEDLLRPQCQELRSTPPPGPTLPGRSQDAELPPEQPAP